MHSHSRKQLFLQCVEQLYGNVEYQVGGSIVGYACASLGTQLEVNLSYKSRMTDVVYDVFENYYSSLSYLPSYIDRKLVTLAVVKPQPLDYGGKMVGYTQ